MKYLITSMIRFSIQIILVILFSFQYVNSQPAKDHFILNGKITGIDNSVIYLNFYVHARCYQIAEDDLLLFDSTLFLFLHSHFGCLSQSGVPYQIC